MGLAVQVSVQPRTDSCFVQEQFLHSGHRGLIHLVKESGELVGEVLLVVFAGLENSDWTSQKLLRVLLEMHDLSIKL